MANHKDSITNREFGSQTLTIIILLFFPWLFTTKNPLTLIWTINFYYSSQINKKIIIVNEKNAGLGATKHAYELNAKPGYKLRPKWALFLCLD